MRIVWFSVDKYNRTELEKMSDKEKYQLALSDDTDTAIWDDVKSFETDLNDDLVNIENGFVFFLH